MSTARLAAAILGHHRRHGRDQFADLAHRRDRERRPGLDATAGRIKADRGEHVPSDRPSRRAVEAPAELDCPATPHRVEVEQRAVLVEDDQVDAVEGAGHTSASTSAAAAAPSRPNPGRSMPPAEPHIDHVTYRR
jgi:hypothetical protein